MNYEAVFILQPLESLIKGIDMVENTRELVVVLGQLFLYNSQIVFQKSEFWFEDFSVEIHERRRKILLHPLFSFIDTSTCWHDPAAAPTVNPSSLNLSPQAFCLLLITTGAALLQEISSAAVHRPPMSDGKYSDGVSSKIHDV
jgi:hypothetical protein